MLGTGLGKRVDAQFVKEAYNYFLGKDDSSAGSTEVIPNNLLPTKRATTKEERRDECRRKGIFVIADDTEMEPTIFEKPATGSRPAVIKDKNKSLRWKKTDVKREKKKGSESGSKEEGLLPGKKDWTAMIRRKTTHLSGNQKPQVKATTLADQQPLLISEVEQPFKKKTQQLKPSSIPVLRLSETVDQQQYRTADKVQGVQTIQQPQIAAVDAVHRLSPSVTDEKKRQAIKVKHTEPESSLLSGVAAQSPCPTTLEQYTICEPAYTSKKTKEKEEVFDKMDDDEFEKLLTLENAKYAEADKVTVDMAKKILKAACREKAFEKALDKKENEVLIRFFSGKIPYDQRVLQILDRALDKIIDWMQIRNVKLSAETRELIERRITLKRALFAEFLINPQYIPQSWAKKYEELRMQSKLETDGINWARVLLCYPTQKSFGDGPADQFGNFTRGKRHWLLAVLVGPSDSKTFAETQREELCRGLYFDPVIMEKAKDHVKEVAYFIPKKSHVL